MCKETKVPLVNFVEKVWNIQVQCHKVKMRLVKALLSCA